MFKLSCPGKIFLAGEYLALKGSSSLVLCIEPCFELEVRQKTELEVRVEALGIPAGSPADRYIQGNREFFKNFELRFIDPYQGRGGYGASSAQFLLVYALLTHFEFVNQTSMPLISISELLSVYHNHSWDGQGWMPSGADVVAQSRGGLVFGNRELGVLEQLSWPFPDLDFVAFSTGTKIATHEHLKTLSLKTLSDFSTGSLAAILSRIEKSIREASQNDFLKGIGEWSEELKQRGWVHAQTLEYLQKLGQDPRVLALKGCGALGADVILVFLHAREREAFLQDWQDGTKGVKISNSFSLKNVSQGIQWKAL
jgi:mevalonate kinase